ncbi:E3 ubiquitin-protein ligase APD2-like isoform X3 [Carya illinoinensis]|uniref:E3 ubiquitin-protein ligase APD2-like isoform X3 n=1 Tax=Carya illinoinensis TaxID=32201 RepID=UPI001C71D58A|nr:E3 ubiquitin-protein ligase APD2-like isoform X3 [Carya illinoinensis]
MEEPEHGGQGGPAPSSSYATTSTDGPSSSSPSTSQLQEEEVAVENERLENGDNLHHHHYHHHHVLLNRHQQWRQQQPSNFPYHLNILISDVASTEMKETLWSYLVLLVTFWFLASMTMILGFYGAVNTQLGPNCSRLIQANPFFVQSIKAEEVNEQKPGPALYGFSKPPPLDVETTWNETHNAFVPANFHKEWIYFLNKGSRVDISYNVKSPTPSPLSLVIAQGRESLVEWIEDPSYHDTTFSWNIIYGSGKIQLKIPESSNYYIAVGNLHSEEVEVELKLTISAFLYNTTQAYYKCSLGSHFCSLKLVLLGVNVAVLTSPHLKEDADNGWYVKLSYGPRWITYFVGSGELRPERAPLLLHIDDDISSWGSSCDSISQDGENSEDQPTVSGIEGEQITEKDNVNNPQHLCVICADTPKNCFFLPCGHCTACFTCGTRIAEEAGICPICQRKMKKVRKIFSV